MNQYPVLDAEEEHRLAVDAIEHHNRHAAETLVYSNLRGVTYAARAYHGYGLPLMDLIQEGTIGLMKAVKAYDPFQGVRLFAWALPWIKSEIQQYVVRNWKMVKAATTDARKKLFFNLRRLKNQALPLGENIRAIALALQIPEKDVQDMDAYMTGSDATIEAIADTPTYDTPETKLESTQHLYLGERARACISELPPREATIVAARYLQEPAATLNELANTYAISMERVRQLEKQGLARIRTMLEPSPS